MSLFMTTELEAILPGEGLHLRHDYRLGTGAAQASQVGVVDYTLPWNIPPVGQGLMKKALHLETIEAAVKLQVAPFGVAQVKKAGHDSVELLPQLESIEGGVVLHLGPGLIGAWLTPRSLGSVQSPTIGQRRNPHRRTQRSPRFNRRRSTPGELVRSVFSSSDFRTPNGDR